MNNNGSKILEAVTVTAELTGTQMSDIAKVAMVEELMTYPLDAVMGALRRCRREIKGRLTLAEILQRLDDGRPGAEEAWATYPKDESGSAVVTTETQQAMQGAWLLIQDGDRVAARMAFKEAYERIVSENRANGVPVRWEVSLGHDRTSREAALADAASKNRISVDRALSLLPPESHDRFRLTVDNGTRALPAPTREQADNADRLKSLLSQLAAKRVTTDAEGAE